MATKGTKVTPREIRRMWELYQELGSYTAVAKKMRRSPDTVSRHLATFVATQTVVAQLATSQVVAKTTTAQTTVALL